MIDDTEAKSTEGLLPDHLKEGWRCYRDWWVARYRSGNPLPAGGVFILNRRAVLMDELFRLHVEAAHGLKVPFNSVKVGLEVDARGRPVPLVDVNPPEGWTPDVPKRVMMESGRDMQRIAQEYVSGYLNVLYQQMQERVKARIVGLGKIRPELQPQEVIRGQPYDTTPAAGQGGSPG